MRLTQILTLCLLLSVSMPRPLSAQSTGTVFGVPVPIATPFVPVGTGSRRLRLVDFTGTPHPDIVRLAVGSANLEVVDLHAPGGSSVAYYPTSAVGDLDVGDVNGDGIADAVVGHAFGVTLVRSSPSGHQTSTLPGFGIPATTRPYFRDVNGDGFVDVVHGQRIYLQSANGFDSTFILANHPVTAIDTAPGDFDGDGDVDFVVLSLVNGFGFGLQLLGANGPLMTSLLPTILAIQGATTATLEVGDMDGDLVPEVVVWGGSTLPGTVRTVNVYRGSANGNLTLHSSFEYIASSVIGSMLLRDLDGDGDRDVILDAANDPSTAISTGSIVAALINDGAGHLSPPTDRAFLTCNGVFTSGAMDVADLELDGGLGAIFHHGSATAAMPIGYGRATRQNPGAGIPVTLSHSGPSVMGTGLLQPTILPLGTSVSINGMVNYVASGTTRDGGGTFVDLSTNGGSLLGPSLGTRPALSDFNGRFSLPVSVGPTIGAADITISTASGLVSNRHFGIGDANLTIVSGNLQAASLSSPFPAPLVVRVTSTAGIPLPGTFVTTSIAGAPVTIAGGAVHVCDANGMSAITATAGATPGGTNVSARILPTRAVTFFLTSFGGIGPNGSTFIDVKVGDSATSSVRVVSPSGQPLAGIPVTFASDPAFVSFTSMTNPVTDASGFAMATFVAGPSSGSASITASSAQGMTSIPVRVLGVSHAVFSPQLIGVRFVDSRPNLPILIAFDLPLPQPIPTVVGVIQTSILAPGPFLQTLDGTGYFGFQDPTYRTDTTSTWFQLFFVPPGIGGITVVTQIYAYDATLPFPQSVTVSNAVYRTF